MHHDVLIDGRFKTERMIGAGGYAETWKAIDQRLERQVALKILRPDLARDFDAQARFAVEADVLSRLNHSAIPRLIGCGKEDGVIYIALEYVEGWQLSRMLSAAANRLELIAAQDVGTLLEVVASAVLHAHERHVIHRDLKPANVMVSSRSDRLPVLVDFGSTRSAIQQVSSREETTVGRVVGTVAYCSPEQLRGETIDERTDVYALGCMLFEVLTSRSMWLRDASDQPLRLSQRPFKYGCNSVPHVVHRILTSSPLPASRLRQAVPRLLDELVLDSLAHERGRRPGSVAEWRKRLREGVALLRDREQAGAGHFDLHAPASMIERWLSDVDLGMMGDTSSGGDADADADVQGDSSQHDVNELEVRRVAAEEKVSRHHRPSSAPGVLGREPIAHMRVAEGKNLSARSSERVAAAVQRSGRRHPDGASSERIAVAVTSSERAAWKESARILGVSLSDLVRQSVDFYLSSRAAQEHSAGTFRDESDRLTADPPPTVWEGLTMLPTQGEVVGGPRAKNEGDLKRGRHLK